MLPSQKRIIVQILDCGKENDPSKHSMTAHALHVLDAYLTARSDLIRKIILVPDLLPTLIRFLYIPELSDYSSQVMWRLTLPRSNTVPLISHPGCIEAVLEAFKSASIVTSYSAARFLSKLLQKDPNFCWEVPVFFPTILEMITSQENVEDRKEDAFSILLTLAKREQSGLRLFSSPAGLMETMMSILESSRSPMDDKFNAFLILAWFIALPQKQEELFENERIMRIVLEAAQNPQLETLKNSAIMTIGTFTDNLTLARRIGSTRPDLTEILLRTFHTCAKSRLAVLNLNFSCGKVFLVQKLQEEAEAFWYWDLILQTCSDLLKAEVANQSFEGFDWTMRECLWSFLICFQYRTASAFDYFFGSLDAKKGTRTVLWLAWKKLLEQQEIKATEYFFKIFVLLWQRDPSYLFSEEARGPDEPSQKEFRTSLSMMKNKWSGEPELIVELENCLYLLSVPLTEQLIL